MPHPVTAPLVLAAILAVPAAASSSPTLGPPVPTHGPVVVAGGGSEDYGAWSDEPYRLLAEVAAGRGAPLVLLDLEAPSSWLVDYFTSFGAAVESRAVPDPAAAEDPDLAALVAGAGAVFVPGGDQWEYTQAWDGTTLEAAWMAAWEGGAALGGTSAGAAILAGLDFTARNGSVYSEEALGDPQNEYMTTGEDFLPVLQGVLVDTHFTERARLGRLLGLLACQAGPEPESVLGIGVDSETAVIVEGDLARVHGEGAAWFMWADAGAPPAECAAGEPLWTPAWNLAALTEGYSFALASRELADVPPGSDEVPDVTATAGPLPAVVTSRADLGAVGVAAAEAEAGTVAVARGEGGVPSLEAAQGEWTELGWEPVPPGTPGADALHAYGAGLDYEAAGEGCCGALRLLQGEAAWGLGGTALAGAEEELALYHGELAEVSGLGAVGAVLAVPEAWDADTGENRQGGALWMMERGHAGEAWLLHGDARARFDPDGTVRAQGSIAPLRLLRDGPGWGGESRYPSGGAAGPRQSAALTGIRIQALGAASVAALGEEAEEAGDDDTAPDDDTADDDVADDDAAGDDDSAGDGGAGGDPEGCSCEAGGGGGGGGVAAALALAIAAGRRRRVG
ncbi:Type 1 glutamine amidotransferase-like domain-containing protein [Myxococcota bacterium]|nr:Type 1 glutamine amidotransferase-like domain-containing protein [Myxococcota bacterium]